MKRIELTQNKYAVVDDDDFERINQYKWQADFSHGNWRARRSIQKINGKRVPLYMHQVIISCPKGFEIDHRNHNGLDNRKCNLRTCTQAENQHNRRIQQQRKTTSQYKGVYWHKRDKIWGAMIRLNNKQIHLGNFLNETEAAKAYNRKAKELFGEFAYLNSLRDISTDGMLADY